MTSEHDCGLWGHSLRDKADTPTLNSDQTADMVIVGGGFTGCAAALEAARQGVSVVLVEANAIGFGGSGRNVGLVNAGLWLPPETIVAQMGPQAGRRLIRLLAAAPDQVFDVIEREGIACEAVRQGTLHLAHAPAGLRDLQDRHRQAEAFGLRTELLDAAETRRRTGTDAYHGALFHPGAGTVQPLAYCHGLARAAMRAGARLFTHSPAQAIARVGAGWQVTANGHRITASRLLMAVNAYPQAGAVAQTPRCTPVFFSQFATDPLPEKTLQTLLPGQEGCWDTGLVMTSVRRDQAGRLILGTMGNIRGIGGAVHEGWMRRELRRLYPALADIPFEHAWAGRIAMTRDHVPKIQRLGPNALTVFGYSGRGIGPGTVFGTAAVRALLSGDEACLPLPAIAGYSEWLPSARAAVFEAGAIGLHGLRGRRPVKVGP
ncbi:NAD(P)/FAD-dependent oxidoreductase [uncultured Roseovarius sp.]|uniref:NAD(P)/FAD-dependent oxidoreductase n=1 Tax=Roseovarius sp. TaxID=1486281 RepID=UPI0025FF2D6B|nr:FAD-binding oxidoreductase [uncultured Roseovarius sp.]